MPADIPWVRDMTFFRVLHARRQGSLPCCMHSSFVVYNRKAAGGTQCWVCLHMHLCYYNWFINAGLSHDAFFMGQQHIEQKLSRHVMQQKRCQKHTHAETQLRFKSGTQLPNGPMSLLLLPLCCLIQFHKAAGNSSYQCVITIFDKQGRPIMTVYGVNSMLTILLLLCVIIVDKSSFH